MKYAMMVQKLISLLYCTFLSGITCISAQNPTGVINFKLHDQNGTIDFVCTEEFGYELNDSLGLYSVIAFRVFSDYEQKFRQTQRKTTRVNYLTKTCTKDYASLKIGFGGNYRLLIIRKSTPASKDTMLIKLNGTCNSEMSMNIAYNQGKHIIEVCKYDNYGIGYPKSKKCSELGVYDITPKQWITKRDNGY